MVNIGFIGAGKVGCSLGKFFSEHGVNIAGYYDRDNIAANEAAQFTDSKAYDDACVLAETCDVLFITVPDGLIRIVYEELAADGGAADASDAAASATSPLGGAGPLGGRLVCHCSGSISSREAFPGIRAKGGFGFSLHPLFAVSDRFGTYRELAGAFFTLEGDEARIDEMKALLEKAGLRYQVIDPEKKTLYHLAAVTASNQMLALIGTAVEELTGCGFSEADARSALEPLVMGNLRHAFDEGPVKALTGPVERGDLVTLEKHLTQLEDPLDRELYRILSRKLVAFAKEKNPDRDYRAMEDFLK